MSQPGQLDGEGRLLRQGDQQLAVLHLRRGTAEAENEETDIARSKHQRVDHDAGVTLTAMERQHAGPDLTIVVRGINVQRLELTSEDFGKRRAGERDGGCERRLFELVVANVCQNAPLLQRVFGNDHRSGSRAELTRRLQQHVSHEAAEIRLTG